MKHIITFFISTLIVIPQVYSMQHIYWSEHEKQILQKQEEARKQAALQQQELLRQQQLREAQRQEEIRQKQIQETHQRQEKERQAQEKAQKLQAEALRQQELLQQQALLEAEHQKKLRQEQQEQAAQRVRLQKQQEEAKQLVTMHIQEEYLAQAMDALTLEDTPVPIELVASANNAQVLPPQAHVAQPQDNLGTQAIISDVIAGLVSEVVGVSQAAKLPVLQHQDSELMVSLAVAVTDGPVSITITPIEQPSDPAASDTKKEDLVEKKDAKLLDGKELKQALALDDKTVQYITQCDWENLFRSHKEPQLCAIFAHLDVKHIDQPDIKTSKYPLHYAAELGFVLLVNLLVHEKNVNVNVITLDGINALHSVMFINGDSDTIDMKCAEIVDCLINAKIDFHCKKPINGATPLYYAVFKKRPRAIPILLTAGARPDDLVGKNLKKQETPLGLAKKRYKKELLPLFEEFASNKKKA